MITRPPVPRLLVVAALCAVAALSACSSVVGGHGSAAVGSRPATPAPTSTSGSGTSGSGTSGSGTSGSGNPGAPTPRGAPASPPASLKVAPAEFLAPTQFGPGWQVAKATKKPKTAAQKAKEARAEAATERAYGCLYPGTPLVAALHASRSVRKIPGGSSVRQFDRPGQFGLVVQEVVNLKSPADAQTVYRVMQKPIDRCTNPRPVLQHVRYLSGGGNAKAPAQGCDVAYTYEWDLLGRVPGKDPNKPNGLGFQMMMVRQGPRVSYLWWEHTVLDFSADEAVTLPGAMCMRLH